MDGTMTTYPMVATRSEVHQGVFDDVSRGFHHQASHRLGVMRSREIPLFFHPIPVYPAISHYISLFSRPIPSPPAERFVTAQTQRGDHGAGMIKSADRMAMHQLTPDDLM